MNFNLIRYLCDSKDDLEKSTPDQFLEWFDSIKSLDLPDKIEEITSKQLQDIIDSYDYVAILWYESNCKKCERVLQELGKAKLISS